MGVKKTNGVTLAEALTELRRERQVRGTVYPSLVAQKKLDRLVAIKRNDALDEAIRILGGIYTEQQRVAAAEEAAGRLL